MSSALLERYGSKYLSNHLDLSSLDTISPYYETYTDKHGREKTRKRTMPQGLSKQDQLVLKSVRRRAHYLDKGFNLCGFKFGYTAILGLIPIAGDAVAAYLNYKLVLTKCMEVEGGLPSEVLARMTFNNLVSAGIGFVPLVGDLALAVWKANSRNAILLEEFLIARAATNLASTSTTGQSTATPSSSTSIAVSDAPEASTGSGKRKWYGWGS